MEALFHLVFMLIKISIQATIYGSLTFIVILIISKLKPESWAARVSKKKFKLWFYNGFIVSVGLLFFAFSYWGNHGLGDHAIVPVGHSQVVEQINSNDTYIEKKGYLQVGINDFAFDKNNLYAKTEKEFNGEKGDYVVWNLKNNDWTFYKTKTDYLAAAEKLNYMKPETFEDFRYHYKQHWHGWRLWFLP